MTQQLAVIPTDKSLAAAYDAAGMMNPAMKVAIASDWATVLMDIVENRKLYQGIGTKKFLYAEAWELIGAFDEATASTRYEPITENGEVVGYKAFAEIVRRGERVGGAEASCYLDASVTTGKTGRSRDRAAQSAAQTWAAAKAFRIKYSYVAVLAGFEPTPAEEMVEGAPQSRGAPMTPIRSEGTTIVTIGLNCPTHPNRNPKQWGGRGDNPAIWKCTAKAPTESGYCEWTAARDLPASPSATVDPPAPPIPPVQELTDFVKAHGWDRANLMDYIDQENLRSVTGGFNAAQVLAAVKVYFADEESEAPEDDSYKLSF